MTAAQELVDTGEVSVDEADIVADGNAPPSMSATCTMGVFAADRLVGYAEVTIADRGAAAVHPEFRGRGIGSWLARWMQERARDRGSRRDRHARTARLGR